MFENLIQTAAVGDVQRVLAETHDVANQAKKKNSDTHSVFDIAHNAAGRGSKLFTAGDVPRCALLGHLRTMERALSGHSNRLIPHAFGFADFGRAALLHPLP